MYSSRTKKILAEAQKRNSADDRFTTAAVRREDSMQMVGQGAESFTLLEQVCKDDGTVSFNVLGQGLMDVEEEEIIQFEENEKQPASDWRSSWNVVPSTADNLVLKLQRSHSDTVALEESDEIEDPDFIPSPRSLDKEGTAKGSEENEISILSNRSSYDKEPVALDESDEIDDPDYVRSPRSSDEEETAKGSEENEVSIDSTTSSSNNKGSADTTKIGKKKTSNPSNWIKNITKAKRNRGEAYLSCSKKKTAIGEKKMREPCNDNCKLSCAKSIIHSKRLEIFKKYWALSNNLEKRAFLLKCIQKQKINEDSEDQQTDSEKPIQPRKPRRPNHNFYFIIDGKPIRVCKTFLKNTLDINDRPIRTVISKSEKDGFLLPDFRGHHKNHKKVDEEIKESVRNHIRQIPRVESHYLRAQTSREYIESGMSLADLYLNYQKERLQQQLRPASETMYSRIFNGEFNISFFMPKKDQCDFCISYENSEGDEKIKMQEEYEKHQRDKISGGNRGANEIGSCVLKYIQTLADTENNENLELIFFSDNCCGQHKNKFIMAMYLYAVQAYKIKSITHKFLLRGHTQNEGDNAHSVIEKEIKKSCSKGPIYTPFEYTKIIKSAKKNGNPYIVHEMDYSDFYDLKGLAQQIGTNYNITVDGKTIKTNDIRVIMAQKSTPGTLFLKADFENEFSEVSVRNTRKSARHSSLNSNQLKLSPAYSTKLPLSDRKKSDISSLIASNLIPKFYEPYYHTLF